jgi:hypothetical protein
MASFAYLKFKMAKPPSMVYWGSNPKYLLRNLEKRARQRMGQRLQVLHKIGGTD